MHKQKQPGYVWVGVALPVGRLSEAQMRGIAMEAIPDQERLAVRGW